MDLHPLYTTRTGVNIYSRQGSKSEHDFIVKYREPGGRLRTPKHIHMIVDLFIKRAQAPALTAQFLDHLVDIVCANVRPCKILPPRLLTFQTAHLQQFEKLNQFGEYSIEFLLVVIELIQTQEITNYPQGNGHIDLYTKLRDGKDIFSVVSAAVFRP